MLNNKKSNWLHVAISWGASIVILGAMFKINHLGGQFGVVCLVYYNRAQVFTEYKYFSYLKPQNLVTQLYGKWGKPAKNVFWDNNIQYIHRS